MQITVNGAPREVPGPLSMQELLTALDVKAPTGIAVLLNGELVRRAEWPQTTVQPADTLEIVRATVGG